MGKKGGSSPPPAPDPYAMVAAQQQANSAAVRESARVNAVDLYGPQGSTTYQRNPDGTPSAQVTQLTPQGQYIFQGQQAISGSLTDQAYSRLQYIPNTPFTLSGLPYAAETYNTGAMQPFNTYSYPRDPGWMSPQGAQFQPPNNNMSQGMFPGGSGYPGYSSRYPGMQSPGAMAMYGGGGFGSYGGMPSPQSSFGSYTMLGQQPAPQPSGVPTQGGGQGFDRSQFIQSLPFMGGKDALMGGNGQGMPQNVPSTPPAPVNPQQPQHPGYGGMPPPGGGSPWGPLGNGAQFGSYSTGSAPQVPGGPPQPGNYPGISYPTSNPNVLPYDPRSYGNIQQFNDQAGNAVYNESMRKLTPEFDLQSRRFEQQMADRGIPVGSEAYNSAWGQLQRSQGDARQSAINNSISAAGSEASRLLGLEQGLRGTSFQEAQTTHQQQNADMMQRLQTEQGLRNQMIQEMLMERNQPFNEASAFLQGAPALGMPQAPNMPSYNVQAPDVIGAQMGAYNAQMQNYNAQQQRQGSMWQGVANLAGSGAMAYAMNPAAFAAFSSRQYKHDEAPAERIIDRVRQMPIYSWRYRHHIDPKQDLHVGPYAEDWQRLIGLGDGRTINVIDAVGVCLKSIKELDSDVRELRDRMEHVNDNATADDVADAGGADDSNGVSAAAA